MHTDTSSALALYANDALDTVPHPDIVLIPGGMAGTFAAAKDQQILAWIQEISELGFEQEVSELGFDMRWLDYTLH